MKHFEPPSFLFGANVRQLLVVCRVSPGRIIVLLFYASSHCSPRMAVANCEQWNIIFYFFVNFLNTLET